MNFKALKCIGLVLGITLTTAYAADSKYWEEFETRGVPLMQHIQDLSSLSGEDSADVRNGKKDALAYFFATGGKYGFQQEPATPDEYDILVKALAVTTTLHYSVDGASVLDLVQVRRGYGLASEDATIQSHLVQAHAIIGYTLCINNYLKMTSPLRQEGVSLEITDIPKKTIQKIAKACTEITTQCYAAPLQALSTKWQDSKLKLAFVGGLTLHVTKEVASILAPPTF